MSITRFCHTREKDRLRKALLLGMYRIWYKCLVAQVIATVCGHTKCTGIVRPGLKHRHDVIVINQELDYVLTGEQVRHFQEAYSSKAWNVLPWIFCVCKQW